MAGVPERLLALQARMQDAGVDLVAIGPTANMRYLLELAPHADERLCLLLVGQQAVRLVVPRVNQDAFAAHTSLELVGWADADGPQDALRQALAGMPAPRSLAVDGSMRADFLLHLQQAVAPRDIRPADALLVPLRQCKSPAEVEALARAAAQADRAMQAAVDALRPGISETELAWTIEAAFRQDGAESVDFTIVASGPHAAFPHHHPGERRLSLGDAVIVDIGATLNGYKSDITRTIHLGQPTLEFARAYAAVLEANRRATAAVRPGVTAEQVDHAARHALEESGYGPFFVHRTGHGIGLEVHEAPYIMAGNALPLAEGMSFSIEPGVYLAGRFGVRIEDIVVVTDTGVRTLTGFGHELIVKEWVGDA